MKLLLDENLSPRLATYLAAVFTGTTHVDLVGLHGQSDDAIWEHARVEGFTIVSKDNDFRQRNLDAHHLILRVRPSRAAGRLPGRRSRVGARVLALMIVSIATGPIRVSSADALSAREPLQPFALTRPRGLQIPA